MKTYTILVLAGCTFAASLSAQTAKKTPTAPKDTLIKRDLVMEKEYQPTLNAADKILISPEVEPLNIEKQPLAFSITESPTTVVGDYNPLPAAGIRITYPSSEQFGYIRLGVGSHRSFLGDAQINLLRQSNQTLDVSFQHRSVFGDLTDINNQPKRSYINKNDLLGSYKLYLENVEINASLAERYQAWNYYGSWSRMNFPNVTMPESFIDGILSTSGGQWSSDSKFGFGIKSKDQGQQFTYTINAEGHHFRLGRGISSASVPSEDKGGREKEFSLKANINYDLSDLLHIGIDAKLRNFSYRSPASWPVDSTSNSNSNQLKKDFANRRWFEFSPYARMTYKKWMLAAGLKLSIPTLESERVKANIVASASTPLGEKAIFTARLDGGVQPLSYREGLEMNLYLDPSIRLKSNWKIIDLSGQIDFRPTPNLRLSPVVSYDVTKDMAFFNNCFPDVYNYNLYGQFYSVKYMTSNRFRIGLNGLYSYRSLLTVLGEVNFNNYLNFSKTDAVDDLLKANGRKAWYKPGLEMRLRADISPMDKLTMFLDYRLEGMRYAADPTSFSKKLEDISDLSLGANYKLTKDVGIFLHLNNLLDQRFEVWNAYPVHGFTAMLGGSVTF